MQHSLLAFAISDFEVVHSIPLLFSLGQLV